MRKFPIIFIFICVLLSCNKKLEVIQFDLAPTQLTMYSTEVVQLCASVSFSGKDSLEMTWSSSDPSTVEVNKYGVVTALEPGSAIITVACEGQEKTCSITVEPETYITMVQRNTDYNSVLLWKNGVLSSLTYTSFNALPTGIDVKKNNVYISGSSMPTSGEDQTRHASYWKDGSIYTLPDEEASSIATGISVYRDTTYISGIIISENQPSKAVYWQNLKLNVLNGSGSANAIVAVNTANIYVGGYVGSESNHQAAIWHNGTETLLQGNQGNILAMYVNNGNVHAVGSVVNNGDTIAAYWNNGNLTTLFSTHSVANAITAYKGDIYISGNKKDSPLNSPFVWKGGNSMTLADSGLENFCHGIAVTRKGVFVAGWQRKYLVNENYTINNPLLWIDNSINYLTQTDSDILPVAIFAR